MVFSTEIGTIKKIGFVISLIMVTAIALGYFYNIEQWSKKPDLGLAFRSATGPNVVGVLTETGRNAGLKIGDRIIRVNNIAFNSISEYRAAITFKTGEENIYLVERDGKTIEAIIVNRPLGFKNVFIRSGLIYLTGLCYIVIGILVFLMKPYYKASTVFYLFCAVFGSLMFFLFRVSSLKPAWFNTVHIFLYAFTPSLFVHLALSFPERRRVIIMYPRLQVAPYILSLFIFVGIRSAASEMSAIPKAWYLVLMAYFIPSVVFFLVSLFYSWLWSRSAIAKARSKLILLGSLLTASVPLLDMSANAFFNTYLVPKFNYYLPFLIIFPIVIAYTIIKHNLFDIDAAIRKTFGYILATLGIALMYTLFIYVPSMYFGMFQLSQSPIYIVLLTVVVLFFFSAIRNKIQKIIDRIFYRVEYDYQEAIRVISEKMRSLMKLDEIGQHMMDTINNTMYVDSGCVMLYDPDNSSYKCLIASEYPESKAESKIGASSETVWGFFRPNPLLNSLDTGDISQGLILNNLEVPADEPFIKKIAETKNFVTYDAVWEDPFFQSERESAESFFQKVNASLIVPMVYEDNLVGLMSLGEKKSGKFYGQEDISLLMTLANQGAIAIETARMVDKIVEKERLEAKILDVFGKYVSQEVRDQILSGKIPLDGETKEVTVLFADLRDFTSLAEMTPPKEIVKIINDYFSEMADSIRQQKGLVLQFIGDEIEAVFGAPLALDDHPTYAVKAALEMRSRLKLVNAKLEHKGMRPLQHGIGIHTGRVVAANIGSAERMSYAMVGDTVNVASRIQELNKKLDTDILISETTNAGLTDEISTTRLPAMKVKGKREPVEVYMIK